MEGRAAGGFLHREDQHDSDVYENRERSAWSYGNIGGSLGSRRGRLLLERNGDERQEGKQRSQRNVPVHARGAGKNAGDASGDYRHADSWAGRGDYREDRARGGAHCKRPARADHRGRWHLPALYRAARTRTAYHRHHRGKSPWRHGATESDDRSAEIRVSNDDRFLVTQEKRRWRDFAPVAKSRDNGVVGRTAGPLGRDAAMQFVSAGRRRGFLRGGRGE